MNLLTKAAISNDMIGQCICNTAN